MTEKISGVYKITNTITSDFYIGSSKDIKARCRSHKSPSQWVKHPNSRMYQDMAQYGLNNFKFEIIDETDNLKEHEQYYIDMLKPSYNNIQASGIDIERRKKYIKEWYITHQEELQNYQKSDKCKEIKRRYRHSEKGKESNRKCARKSMKRYNNQLCLYNGETIKLNALAQRFYIAGIEHPVLEAKKYLLDE